MSRPVGPYTPVVRAGDFLIVSGQVGSVEGKLVGDGLEEQMRQIFTNLSGLLEANGAQLSDVVKTTVFLADMADFPRMNELYVEGFGDTRPARSAIGVAALPLGARVEIEAWVHRPEGSGTAR